MVATVNTSTDGLTVGLSLTRTAHGQKNTDRGYHFQLRRHEADSLPLQIARANRRGGRRTLPYAFTEQGVAMLSSVLRSHRAALVNIAIMRAFVRIREVLSTHKDLAQKIEALEAKYMRHDVEIERHNVEIQEIFEAIRQLIEQPVPPQRQIGFKPRQRGAR